MVGDMILCLLAACGVALVLWCMVGWALFPCKGRRVILLYAAGEGETLEQELRAQRWLRKSGLLCGRAIVVDCGLTTRGAARAQRLCSGAEEEFCSEAELPMLLKTE